MNQPLSVALDPTLQAVVDHLRAQAVPALFSLPIEQARERVRLATETARQRCAPPAVWGVEDTQAVDGDHQVPVRVYRPGPAGPARPTVVFFHGGGFALGSVASADTVCRHLCDRLDAVVVSAEYRLAPEHRFPAAHDDALLVGRWAVAAAARLGGDAQQVVVAGESAGANLATCTALRCVGTSHRLAAQLLIVPGVDFARDLSALRSTGEDHPLLTPDDLDTISRLYLGGATEQALLCPPSPGRAPTLAGLPPAVVAVAGHDHLREEGLRYASAMQAAGVPVSLLSLDAMPHPFLAFLGVSPGVDQALDQICHALRRLLATHAPRVPFHNKETP
jgi:acetyl esterase